MCVSDSKLFSRAFSFQAYTKAASVFFRGIPNITLVPLYDETLGVWQPELNAFDGIFDIAAADFVPKPHSGAYERFLKQHNVDPLQAVMFEDLHPNLRMPHEMGMTTVLVHSGYDDHPSQKGRLSWQQLPDYINFETDDLVAMLQKINVSLSIDELP